MAAEYSNTNAAIRTLARQLLGRSVVFAATHFKAGARQRLVLELLRATAHFDHHPGLPTDPRFFTIRKDPLGAPILFLQDRQGPSLSFSHDQDKLWAAMCSGGRVGIDVAYPQEFDGDYPFARVFGPEELDRAKSICPNDAARGAALVWSVKEASVKAIGTGFNRLDPVEVRVGTPLRRDQGFLFEVMADRPVAAWAQTEGRGWLSLALDRQN